MWDDELDEEDAGGVAGDVFLHMVDAWVQSKLGALTDARIDAAMRKLDEFTEAMGDRFEDAADLERAQRDWEIRVGARKARACSVLTDVLSFWKAVEAMDVEDASGGGSASTA